MAESVVRGWCRRHGLFGVWRFFYTRKTRLVFKWWSWQNWRKGYQFRPVQRFRCCEHTTPYHYADCDGKGAKS